MLPALHVLQLVSSATLRRWVTSCKVLAKLAASCKVLAKLAAWEPADSGGLVRLPQPYD
jgi:hypothetical protein